MLIRLQKYLARAGVASRRASESLITSGHVSINGVVVSELGSKVDDTSDVVEIDGAKVELPKTYICLMLNKPIGYITTMSDPQRRPTVASLVPIDEFPSLFPVGRLDKNTSGLLLFTTSGELGNALLHPKNHVYKTYIAKVKGRPSDAKLEALRTGVDLEDGRTAPAKVRFLTTSSTDNETSTIEIEIHEGKKREVRRMFEHIGHEVISLHRTKFANLELGDLASGQWRMLEDSEVALLQ